MPPKVKKGLKNEQIESTLSVVQQYWPDYQITPNLIKNPTKAFVLKLYTDCVQNLDEKLAYATRTQLLPHPPGLGEEELLFLKLSRIPSLAEADFKLGDLYSFDPIRVSNHILIIMHFLMFTDSIMDRTVQICNAVFDAKEKMKKNEDELKQLKKNKLDKQIQVTELKTEKKKLKDETATIAPEYEATVALIEEIQNKCKEKIEEMDKLKVELEIIEKKVTRMEENGSFSLHPPNKNVPTQILLPCDNSIIQKLEIKQVYLKNRIVPEEEHNSLKNTVATLKIEEKNLEEIDVQYGLLEQKQGIDHLQTCLSELNHLELSEDIFKLSNYRRQRKDKKESSQYALDLQKNRKAEINALKLKVETEKREVELAIKELKEELKKITDQGRMKEQKMKKKYQQMDKDNEVKIMESRRLHEKCEADCIRLQKGLKEQYNAICQKQDMALERFKSFINKVNGAVSENMNVE